MNHANSGKARPPHPDAGLTRGFMRLRRPGRLAKTPAGLRPSRWGTPAQAPSDAIVLPAASVSMVPGAGLEPARPCGQGIFGPLRLSPPPKGSWSGARLHRSLATLGARRLLSTPSPVADRGLARCQLELCSSGPSPSLTGFTSGISPRGLKLCCLSPLRLPIPPLGHRGIKIWDPKYRDASAGLKARHHALSGPHFFSASRAPARIPGNA
jgi:hypothetical protein